MQKSDVLYPLCCNTASQQNPGAATQRGVFWVLRMVWEECNNLNKRQGRMDPQCHHRICKKFTPGASSTFKGFRNETDMALATIHIHSLTYRSPLSRSSIRNSVD